MEQRRQAVEDVRLVLQWADLHGDDPPADGVGVDAASGRDALDLRQADVEAHRARLADDAAKVGVRLSHSRPGHRRGPAGSANSRYAALREGAHIVSRERHSRDCDAQSFALAKRSLLESTTSCAISRTLWLLVLEVLTRNWNARSSGIW